MLREMAARVLTGERLDHIARDLNQGGVATSTDGMWSRESVKQLLLRERNVGQVVHNGVVVGHLPGEPILDNETWERLTTLFASRRRGRPASEMYLCSGIVRCGKCGNRLTGRPKQPYSNGEICREYFANRARSVVDAVVPLLANVSWTGMSERWWSGFGPIRAMLKPSKPLPRRRRTRGAPCSPS